MNNMITSLTNRNDLSAWQVNQSEKTTQELYMVGGDIDALRSSTSRQTKVLIHTSQGLKIGENRFSFEGECADPENEIHAAMKRASLVHNDPYPLSPPWQINPEIQNPVFDIEIANDASGKLQETAELVQKLGQKLPGKSQISFLECFLTHKKEQHHNHLGLSLQTESTGVMYDLALLTQDRSSEVYVHLSRNRLADLPLTELLEEETRALLDIHSARILETGRYPVILSGEALDTLFNYFTAHASAESLYQGYCAFEEGKPVLAKEFPLTIRSNPWMPGGAQGGFYDFYGFALSPVNLIENGILKNFAVNGKYAAHLDRPMTSALSNIEVEPGDEPLENLRENGVIELVKFSTFSPDPVSGSFSGEIRLGYLYQNGRKIPIKGGSVSAAGPQIFANATFSSEITQRESYRGPAGVHFQELIIAGEGNS